VSNLKSAAEDLADRIMRGERYPRAGNLFISLKTIQRDLVNILRIEDDWITFSTAEERNFKQLLSNHQEAVRNLVVDYLMDEGLRFTEWFRNDNLPLEDRV